LRLLADSRRATVGAGRALRCLGRGRGGQVVVRAGFRCGVGFRLGRCDMMIRSYRESDNDAVIALSLRAWAPVFVSLEQVMDPDVYDSFYPDGWREHQRDAVRAARGNQDAWVAEEDGVVIGFASVVLHADDGLG